MACDLTTGLVALYHFTGNANDSSGNGNHGTVTGASLTTDKNAVSNQAYSFPNSASQIDLGSGASLNISGDISVSAWINMNDVTTTRPLVCKTAGGPNYDQYSLFVTGSKIYFRVRNTTNAVFDAISSTISNGTWYHAVGVVSGTTVKLYVDGVLQATTATVTGTRGTVSANAIIGYMGYATTSYLYGKIDEVWIFSVALSQESINALYSGYDAATCPTGYSNKVNGITPSKVDEVAVANISKVDGI